MTDQRQIDPKDNRDWLTEAFRIAEGGTNIVPRREHVRALHSALMGELQKSKKIGDAISTIAKLSRERKLRPEDVPYLKALFSPTTTTDSNNKENPNG